MLRTGQRPAGAAAGERRIYVSGLLIVAVSTACACAFAHTYWQLLLFRSLGGIGSTMFFVSALGLMIRISPARCARQVGSMFSSAFLVGSVAGPVLGSLTAGLGLNAPFLIYGAALLVAAAVVFISLRHSTLAAPAEESELTVTVGVRCVTALTARRCCRTSPPGGRRSGCGSRWCHCSSPSRCIAVAGWSAWRWLPSPPATCRRDPRPGGCRTGPGDDR